MTEPTGSGTWHHGLVARWWAEFEEPEPDALAWYRGAVERFGQPVLDLGCGTGRLLLPLAAAGIDIDGTDVSADMIGLAAERARRAGLSPRLAVQPLHELEMPRTYRLAFMCGVLGIGGRRDRDAEALRRVLRLLEPGGALVVDHRLPYDGLDEERWARWLPGRRASVPRPWPDAGDRRTAADGDEIELLTRLADLDPLVQRQVFAMRARLWRDGRVVREEERTLVEALYFAQEVRGMLEAAGFADIVVEAAYAGRPAAPDDGAVLFIARRPESGRATGHEGPSGPTPLR
jgi:SAM-dependent methyltransferase